MKYVVWGLVVLLIILHQDFWFWDDPSLVFGFIPIGLFYHVCLSIAASATWYLATIYAWPVQETTPTENETSKGGAH